MCGKERVGERKREEESKRRGNQRRTERTMKAILERKIARRECETYGVLSEKGTSPNWQRCVQTVSLRILIM